MNKVEQRFVPLFSRSDVQLMVGLEPHTDQQMLESMSNPFCRLGESSTSYFYAGRLVSRFGFYNTKVVIAVKKDHCHPAFSSNQQHDQMAKEQLIAHTILGPQSESPLERMFAHLPSQDTNGNQNLFGPLMFCKQKLMFFNPPCPDCGDPLKDCRDEDYLSEQGLSGYNDSTQRYLFCSRCAEDEHQKPKFYATHSETEKNILGPKELVSSFTNLFNLIDKDLEEVPCLSCEHRAACYPDGADIPSRALELLVPFSFHNFYIRVLEHYPYTLGDVLHSLMPTANKKQKISLGRIYADPKDARFVVETVLAKMNLFFKLAAQSKEFILKTGRPHSDLSPDNIVIKIHNKDSLTPFYWNFDLKLRGIDNVISNQGTTGMEWKAIRGNRPEFQHPSIRARGSISEAVDFYSLGVLFFNIIFGLDKKDFDLVMQRCLSFVQKLKSGNIADFDEAKRFLVAEIEKNLMQHLPKSTVLNQGLWKEILLVGFRLVNDHGDFAYYQGSLDKAFINLLKDVSVLRSKMYRMLFHESPVLKQDLQQVIWELLGASGQNKPSESAAASPPSENSMTTSRADVEKIYGIAPQSGVAGDNAVEQTLIMNPSSSASFPPEKPHDPAGQDDFDSTMIIGQTQDRVPADPPKSPAVDTNVFADDSDATMVINKSDLNIRPMDNTNLSREDLTIDPPEEDWGDSTLVIKTQDTYSGSHQNSANFSSGNVFANNDMLESDFMNSSAEDSLEDATIVFKPNRDNTPVFPQEDDAPVGDDATIIMKRDDIGDIKDEDSDQFGSDTVIVRSSFLKDKDKDK